MDKQKLLKEIWSKLDYWCEQYQIATANLNRRFLEAYETTGSWSKADELLKNDGELERISKNIKDLETTYETVKNLF